MIICVLHFRNSDEDPRKLNEDRTCCICLEEYVDEQGNIKQSETNTEGESKERATGTDEEHGENSSLEHKHFEQRQQQLRHSGHGHGNIATDQQNRLHTRRVFENGKYIEQNKSDYRIPVLEDDLILGLLKCGHAYHFECIWKWMQSRTKCPICRNFTNMSANEIKAVTYTALFTNSTNEYSDKAKGNTQDLPLVHKDRKCAIFTVDDEMKKIESTPSNSEMISSSGPVQNQQPIRHARHHQRHRSRSNRSTFHKNDRIPHVEHLPRTQWCMFYQHQRY